MRKSVRFSVAGVVTAAVVGAFLLRGVNGPTANSTAPAPTPRERAEAPVPLPRLVDLGKGTCIPCKMMAPILEELTEQYTGRFIVEVIDLREDADAARRYGIRVIPTQIFYDASGVERFRHEGFMAKDAILAKWRELGVDLQPRPGSQAGTDAESGELEAR